MRVSLNLMDLNKKRIRTIKTNKIIKTCGVIKTWIISITTTNNSKKK